jgi:hypothetical protein
MSVVLLASDVQRRNGTTTRTMMRRNRSDSTAQWSVDVVHIR